MTEKAFLVKIVLAGDGAVGKTTLRRRYLGEGFQSSYMMTIGADFAVKRVKIGGKEITFQIWDLAGQPRFEVVRQGFYRGARGGLLVYDVTRRRTFLNIQHWKEECFKNLDREVPVIVVANKVIKSALIRCRF